MPPDTEQELPLGEAGSPEGEPDEGRGAAGNIAQTTGESVETYPCYVIPTGAKRSGGIHYVGGRTTTR